MINKLVRGFFTKQPVIGRSVPVKPRETNDFVKPLPRVPHEPAKKAEQPEGQGGGRQISSVQDWRLLGGPDTLPADLIHANKQGIEPVTSRELMEANRLLIEQALDSFTNKAHIENFDDHIFEMVRRFAHWMGAFPASMGHHHVGRGGLFTHSIGVAVGALHMSGSKNVSFESTPRNRDADILAWQLVCFVCGLLHDIGKLHTTGRVFAMTVSKEIKEGSFYSQAAPTYDLAWEPMVEGFENWVQVNRVKSYYLDFQQRDTLTHKEFVVRHVTPLIPRPLLAFIYYSNRNVRQQFEDFIRNPESGARTPIFQIIKDADHINVAQSIDPQRKPGTLELTSLILRRFTEFAADTAWNLPNSPFIYAHVQKKTLDGTRFLGVPFFVATEAAIESFIQYIKDRPLLGVSLGNRAYELIFNCLETANIMCRTIDGLLPQQIAMEDLQGFIPASKATVRFAANAVLRPIKDASIDREDVLIELPVVPISITVPSSVNSTAPTLAFYGVPDGKAATVIPVVVDEGKIALEDVSARNDPNYQSELRRIMDAHDNSQSDAEALLSMTLRSPGANLQSSGAPTVLKVHHTDKGKGSRKASGKGALPLHSVPADAIGEDKLAIPGRDPADNSATSPPLAKGDETKPKAAPYRVDDPAWVRAYIDLTDAPRETARSQIWAVIWLYVYENQQQTLMAKYIEGRFALRGNRIPQPLRTNVTVVLSERKLSFGVLSAHWPATPIFLKASAFNDVLQCERNDAYLPDGAAKLIEAHIGLIKSNAGPAL